MPFSHSSYPPQEFVQFGWVNNLIGFSAHPQSEHACSLFVLNYTRLCIQGDFCRIIEGPALTCSRFPQRGIQGGRLERTYSYIKLDLHICTIKPVEFYRIFSFEILCGLNVFVKYMFVASCPWLAISFPHLFIYQSSPKTCTRAIPPTMIKHA